MFGAEHAAVPVTGYKRKMSASMGVGAGDGGVDAAVPGLSLCLTDEEAALFALLMEVVSHSKLSCVLRVAGGWVRDKIMGLPSHDIDIAIDDQMGKDFAEKVVEFMHSSGRGSQVGSVGVIKSNPDQSKHLETATVRVMGFEIDFVNLRAEEYTDTRIPVMRIGTALEDASRRDLTINALFYNINKKCVEDYTGQGIADIQTKTIRTPLQPQSTMTDDPLRALRAVRFGARFDFTMVPELEETLQSTHTHEALATKVSRERVCTELNGMLLGPAPGLSLKTLYRLKLLPLVFQCPPESVPSADWPDHAIKVVSAADDIPRTAISDLYGAMAAASEAQPQVKGTDFMPKDPRRLLYLCAALLPLHGFEVKAGKKPVPSPEYVIRTSLKGAVKDAQETALVLEASVALGKSAEELANQDKDEMEKKMECAACLRKAGALWRLGMLLAVCKEIANGSTEGDAISRHTALSKKVEDAWGLEKCWTLKPLLSGTDIASELGLDVKKDGKRIGALTKDVLDWTLRQPRPMEASREECLAWLKGREAAAS